MAEVVKISNVQSFQRAVQKAVLELEKGGVVALPTDTIYGVTALLEHSEKLYSLKRRPSEKPLGLFVADVSQIRSFGIQTVPDALLSRLLPGPVTLIFQRSDALHASFNPDCESVGFRIPDDALVRAICQQLYDRPLAQTSANVSGSPLSPLCTEDFEDLWPELDLIVDRGRIEQQFGSRQGSTIVDLSTPGCYTLVRPGCAQEETEAVLLAAGLKRQVK
ncbi:YrdC domain-containing protein [Aphelenchoides avenae]|nr:YrdC domain-containing protein [Aphelenchus avenae]